METNSADPGWVAINKERTPGMQKERMAEVVEVERAWRRERERRDCRCVCEWFSPSGEPRPSLSATGKHELLISSEFRAGMCDRERPCVQGHLILQHTRTDTRLWQCMNQYSYATHHSCQHLLFKIREIQNPNSATAQLGYRLPGWDDKRVEVVYGVCIAWI